MQPDRWHIRSLRRFEDGEIALAIYFFIGGVLSLVYTVGAVINTRLYVYLFSGQAIEHYEILGRVVGHIIVHAIKRVVLWFPEIFWQVIVNQHSFYNWLTGADILKGIS